MKFIFQEKTFKDNSSKESGNRFFIMVMVAVLCLQLAALFYYGNQKAGFHEDELYTYYSTNKTAGLFVNDRQWMERDELRNDFVVLPGEQFRYHIVKQMQSWDVHPPMYYYIFHTVCSLFPGVFDKWLGIGVNMAAYVLCYMLLAYGVYTASSGQKDEQKRKGRFLALLTCLFWGFSGAVISGVMFIRMYQWLTLFVLLCMDLHLRALKKKDFGAVHFLLPIGITVFLGFLTQYYYIIFHFFLGAGFCLYLLKNKKIKELFSYVVACGLGLLGAILYYPASLSHIFRGYRGTEAVSEFGDMSNTWERLRFFYGLFDDFVMNGSLSGWLLVLCLLAVTAGYFRKRRNGKSRINSSVVLILFACGGYFFTISKTALLLGETSNRYQFPIYGLIVFLLLYGMWTMDEELAALLAERRKDGLAAGKFLAEKFAKTSDFPEKRREWIMAAVLAVILVLTDALALKNGRVFFLYEEEKEIMEFVKAHRQEPVVVFYNEASSDNIWRLSDELMEYPRVYLASQGNKEPIEDEVLLGSESLLAYVADYEDKEACLERLVEENNNLSSWQVVAEKGLWTLYEVE